MSDPKRYLGDGVYATFDGYHIWLATDIQAIALDPEVFVALQDFAESVFNAPEGEQSDGTSNT